MELMNLNSQSVPFEKWPQPLRRLGNIFSTINTNLTFLASHSRSTIPTYDHCKRLLPDLTKSDLAAIKHFMPKGDVFFNYVDENSLIDEDQKPAFSWKSGYEQSKATSMDDVYAELDRKHRASSQLLIFQFEDIKIDGIGFLGTSLRRKIRRGNDGVPVFSHQDLNTKKLTHEQLLSIIRARRDTFDRAVSAFILTFGDLDSISANIFIDEEVSRKLRSLVEAEIPVELDYEDPIRSLKDDKRAVNPSDHLSADDMVDILKSGEWYKDQVKFEGVFTEKSTPKYGNFDVAVHNIHPDLVLALNQYKGINMETDLYVHQTEALDSILGSEPTHVIISTSTSSGKSLIYQIPIINEILWDIQRNGSRKVRNSTAIFMFPTKALAQDQKKHLDDLLKYIPLNMTRNIIVETYDGDTETKYRNHIRKFADIIFTNPDTIHASILPNHDGFSYGDAKGWEDFLRALKYIIIDEIHVYKGTFGIHVSYVMARLFRIVKQIKGYSDVRFISCSATVLDPASHFRHICSIPKHQKIVHVSNDGSSSCEKKILVWQPSAMMNKKGQVYSKDNTIANSTSNPNMVPRTNIIVESSKVLLQLLTKSPSLKVIAFCPIRKMCEMMMKEVRTLIAAPDSPFAGVRTDDVMAYRGGYSKGDRRRIEQKMFDGQLRALVATNALELGVDLSDLDVVITCGFPQSKSNLHQQFGRAGRGRNAKGSLAIFVVGNVPVDQYYLEHPEELCDKNSYEDLGVESLISIEMYQLIMELHLQCAAFEQSIVLKDDAKWFCHGGKAKEVKLFEKVCKEKLLLDEDGTYKTDRKYMPWPADHVSIRAIEETNYAVVDITNNRNIVIEEIEESRTSFTLYEGGIFLHQGMPYLVKEFNSDEKYAKVQRVKVDWTTQQRDFTDVDPIEIEYVKCLNTPFQNNTDLPVYFGKIETTIVVFGYFKVNRKNEIMEAVEVKNPPIKYLSKGFWLDIPKLVIELIKEKNLSAAAGIHAAQHAIMNILPIFINGGASTNSNVKFSSNLGEAELITECKAPEKEFAQRQSARKRPARLVFYDSKGGERGSGISAKTFEHIDKMLVVAYERIKTCSCDWGCPKCINATFCKEMSVVMSKPAAQIILGCLIGEDPEKLRQEVPDGPEENLPDMRTETIEPATSVLKFARDVEIIEVRRAETPISIKKEDANTI